jgi:hypothetical protein
MDTTKFRRLTDLIVGVTAAAVAATPLVVSHESQHHYHTDPEQPQQQGSMWATTISGTGSLSAVGASTSAGTFDLREGWLAPPARGSSELTYEGMT